MSDALPDHNHICPSCNSIWDCYDENCTLSEPGGDALCPTCEDDLMEVEDDYDFTYDEPPYEDEEE